MSWRNKVGESLHEAAAVIALAPAQLMMKVAPDHGPGSTAYAVLLMIPSIIITSPITIPIFMLGTAFKEGEIKDESKDQERTSV